MKIKHIIIAATSVSLSQFAGAQNLSTEITVDRTVVAELPPASPLHSVVPTMPKLSTPDVSLNPAQYSRTTNFTPIPGALALPLYTGIKPKDPYKGYLWAGYLPAYNLGAAAGYRIIDNASTQLNAAVRFNGASYHTPLKLDKATVSNNTFGVQADVNHALKAGARIGADVEFFHASLNSPMAGIEDFERGVNSFDLGANIAGGDAIRYSGSIRYSHFGQSKDYTLASNNFTEAPSDNRLVADARVGLNLNSYRTVYFEMGVNADVLATNGVEYVDDKLEPFDRTSAILDFNPSFRFDYLNVDVRLGARIDIGVNSPDKAYHVAPDVALAWMPSGKFTAFATLGGGEKFRTQRWQYELSPYALSSLGSNRIFAPIDGRVGFNLRPVDNLNIGISAGYASVKNSNILASVYHNIGSTILYPVHFAKADISGWNIGAEMSYNVENYGGIHAAVRHYCHGDYNNADRAKYVVEAGLTVKPIEKLSIGIDYELRALRSYLNRTYQIASIEDTSVALDNVSNVALSANYAFTPQFNVFAHFENLLCRRYTIIPVDVQSQRLHGLLGVSYRF